MLVIARVATTNLRWTDRLLWRLIAASWTGRCLLQRSAHNRAARIGQAAQRLLIGSVHVEVGALLHEPAQARNLAMASGTHQRRSPLSVARLQACAPLD